MRCPYGLSLKCSVVNNPKTKVSEGTVADPKPRKGTKTKAMTESVNLQDFRTLVEEAPEDSR